MQLYETPCQLLLCQQAAKAWGEEEKVNLRNRERRVQEAEEGADELLRSATADIDRQGQALQQQRQAFQQVR